MINTQFRLVSISLFLFSLSLSLICFVCSSIGYKQKYMNASDTRQCFDCVLFSVVSLISAKILNNYEAYSQMALDVHVRLCVMYSLSFFLFHFSVAVWQLFV